MSLQAYKSFRPTEFDAPGLGLDDRQDWLVLPVGRNRDSDPLPKSNFYAALERMGGESETVEVHRFGHWACGWIENVIIHPSRATEGEAIAAALDYYPILDDEDFRERERVCANATWRQCYNTEERIEYLRDNEGAEFHSFSALLSCVRGHFAPYTHNGYDGLI